MRILLENYDVGVKKSSFDETQLDFEDPLFDPPREIDWSRKGAVSEVKDQRGCYSSWAFTTTGIIEGAIFLASNKTVSLSEQNLLDCSEQNNVCKYGDPNKALKYVQDHGIDTEWSYKYNAKRGKCGFNTENIGGKITNYKSTPLKGKASEKEKSLKAIVALHGPVGVRIPSRKLSSFINYKGGIYNDPNCKKGTKEEITHLLLVGYGTSKEGNFWIAKGSFGIKWGEKGYIRIASNGKNVCGIANQVHFIERKK